MESKFFAEKKVLITGDTGFKGSWLASVLVQFGAKVYGYSKYVDPEGRYSNEQMDDIYPSFRGDVLDRESLRRVFNDVKPELVFHLAAQAFVSEGYQDPMGTYEVNIIGTANVVSLAIECDSCLACVAVTSDKCYENVETYFSYREHDALGGKDPYSASKASAEIVIRSLYESFGRASDCKVVSVRAGNVIGGGDGSVGRLVPEVFKCWLKGEVALLRRPESTRPWQHVLEPVFGYLRVAETSVTEDWKQFESFNFGPDIKNCVKVEELVSRLQVICGFDNMVRVESTDSFYEAEILMLNLDKVHAYLGWSPTLTLKETLELTADWYLKSQTADIAQLRKISTDQVGYFLEKLEHKINE